MIHATAKYFEMVGFFHANAPWYHECMLKRLIAISRELSRRVDALTFSEPVHIVYNPLKYAWKSHKRYIEKFGSGKGRVLLLGMNPGPWGMAQSGVPFGEVSAVSEFLGICNPVNKPVQEHPKRPIQGFDCPRSEVSGRRVWDWAKERFGTPEHFFSRFYIINYCPLCFMEEGGKNRTPDKLKPEERAAVFEVCDVALRKFVDVLEPSKIVGIGGFARKRAMQTLERDDIETILHPSPASPMANRGWAPQIEKQFEKMGITLPIKQTRMCGSV